MKSSEKMIAVAFDLNFRHAAEIFSGVSDYIAEAQLDWQLVPLNFGFEPRLMELAASGQLSGAVGTFVSDGWVEGLTKQGVRAVNLFNFSKIERIPSVCVDDASIGRSAAEHLIAQGARQFVFLGADGIHYTRLRKAGFLKVLGERPCSELRPGAPLRDQIQDLHGGAFPIGVFCSSDGLARAFIQEARQQELSCGKDILVVGIDNDPSESIFAGIGISSFKLPTRQTGYLAAKTLHQSFSNSNAPAESIIAEGTQLIPRASSLASGRARIAQQAANLLSENLSNPELDIEHIARRVGVSRRSLELAFKEQLGTSPYRLISQARLARAKELLRSTTHPIMEVGRLCGYPEQHHFSAWFKKQSGNSPKAYRDSAPVN